MFSDELGAFVPLQGEKTMAEATANVALYVPNHLKVGVLVPLGKLDTIIAKPLPLWKNGCIHALLLLFNTISFAGLVRYTPIGQLGIYDLVTVGVVFFTVIELGIHVIIGKIKQHRGYGRFAHMTTVQDSAWIRSYVTCDQIINYSSRPVIIASIPLDEVGVGEVMETHGGRITRIGSTQMKGERIFFAYGEHREHKFPPIHIHSILELLEINWFEISQKYSPGKIMTIRSSQNKELRTENNLLYDQAKIASTLIGAMTWEDHVRCALNLWQDASALHNEACKVANMLEQEMRKLEKYDAADQKMAAELVDQQRVCDDLHSTIKAYVKTIHEKFNHFVDVVEAIVSFHKGNPKMLNNCIQFLVAIHIKMKGKAPGIKKIENILAELRQTPSS